ncbi:MAG TPA: 2-hydroxyacid dehydrogenase [Burkholderiales bacterium]|nr:2-hydroxyacid dehydrogenase [Burkholderiales bacterium]
MKPEILVTVPLYGPTLAELEREYTAHRLWVAGDPDAFLRQVAASVRGVVTTGLAGLARSRIEALPRLEIIACVGTPHGTVDLATAQSRGVVVTNTPDSITELVAELAMGLIITVMRRICETDRFVRAGKWRTGVAPMGTEVRGKACGIVGLGRIGRGVARRAEACGMSVHYYGPHPKHDVSYPYHADLESMARLANCLVVTCPATPATRNLVDARILDALGPEGFLVNVARGTVVDEPALIAALGEKRIAGAGLDVFRDEPRVPPELIAMDSVVLTPHIGTSTREIREERGRKLLANLRAHFSGKPAINPVSGEP